MQRNTTTFRAAECGVSTPRKTDYDQRAAQRSAWQSSRRTATFRSLKGRDTAEIGTRVGITWNFWSGEVWRVHCDSAVWSLRGLAALEGEICNLSFLSFFYFFVILNEISDILSFLKKFLQAELKPSSSAQFFGPKRNKFSAEMASHQSVRFPRGQKVHPTQSCSS